MIDGFIIISNNFTVILQNSNSTIKSRHASPQNKHQHTQALGSITEIFVAKTNLGNYRNKRAV